jgi:hypothetical protein
MPHIALVAGIMDGFDSPTEKSPPPLRLPDRQQPDIRSDLTPAKVGDSCFAPHPFKKQLLFAMIFHGCFAPLASGELSEQ